MTGLHPCAALACTRTIEAQAFLCFRHWSELAPRLRNQFGVNAADAPEELKAEAITYLGRRPVYWDGLALRDEGGSAIAYVMTVAFRDATIERLGARIVGRPR